jgi:glycosyltransferase involved in cell wall biosynthesis
VTGRLTVAVCTGRVDDLARRWEQTLAHVTPAEYLVVVDAELDDRFRAVTELIRARGATVLCHDRRRGLSAARNTALDARPDGPVLFVDDDVLLDRAAVDAAREAFAAGAAVVGARLVPPPGGRTWPWFFTTGQMHLVGWHPPHGPVKTWGAFMGVDAAFAARHGLRFDARLGRTGRRLESGDDTTFVAQLKASGGPEVVLPVEVVHDVDETRLSVRYLSRRVYWQGRSEVRRGQPLPGLRKELSRHLAGGQRPVLVPWYLAAFLVGVGHETLAGRATRPGPAGRP